MRLTIPKSQKPGLQKLIGLSPPLMESLIAAIAKMPPTTSLYDAAAVVSDNIAVDFDDLYNILSVVVGIHRASADAGVSTDEFLSDLFDALRAEDDPKLRPAGGEWEQLRSDLERILESGESLSITSKASELLSENERRFCPENCRVLSDIRPIFLGAPSGSPAASVIQHVLKIAYHEGDNLKEFFVTLDASDIRTLQDHLHRAIVKEDSLRSLMEEKGIQVVGPVGNGGEE